MLLLLVVIPIVAALLIAFASPALARRIAGASSLLFFALTVACAFVFDWSDGAAFQMPFRLPLGLGDDGAAGVALEFGVDGVAMLLIMLTGLLAPLCVFGSFSSITDRVRTYYAWLLALQAPMVAVFLARDLITFYVAFEFTLVPMYVLISLFGSTNRKHAATKFFLFTFTGSLMTLAGLLYVVWFNATQLPLSGLGAGEWSFNIGVLMEAARQMSATEQAWVLLAMMCGFAVKTPLFPVHTWLPLAHTEAPTAGSVVLAGVLLKLGTYGLYRFVIPFVPVAVAEYAPLIAIISIIGIVYAGLICWVQRDVKKLVAYSSVSHLGFCVLGLFALNSVGSVGSVMYMINHGLSTGALFFCVGMMYERYHTRSLEEVGGLAKKMPVWAFFTVFFTLASVGLPGLNGFVSEIMCLLGAFQSGATWGVGGTPGPLGPWFAAVAATGMIIAAIYLLYMVGRIVFGPLREPEGHEHHGPLPVDLNRREILVLAPLAALCLFLGLYPRPALKALEAPVAHALAGVHEHRATMTANTAGALVLVETPPLGAREEATP
ncbi:MAG: NADH-quinone oxidoreductase subunit M [Phycisphaerales bacterium]|nr:MAG: NADH-quinone oxidoreductase subunit M [Phycisphaerales bacterium]